MQHMRMDFWSNVKCVCYILGTIEEEYSKFYWNWMRIMGAISVANVNNFCPCLSKI
jgi:hypothetical protein